MANPPLPVAPAPADRLVSRTLCGRTYELRESPSVPLWKAIVKTGISVALLPLAVPLGLLWTAAVATPLRESLLSMIIPRIMRKVDKEFKRERRALLSGISGRVLDVGSGGGAYLRHLSNPQVAGGNVDVVALEPNAKLHPLIRMAGKDLPGPLTIVSAMEELTDQDDETFDWVILGNVLCEVDDVPRTVDRVSRLLKPGGKLYFQEHVARGQGTWQRRLQDLVNPLRRHISGGCNCNRESDRVIRKHSCWECVVEWQYDHMQVVLGPMVLGLAQKRLNPSRDASP
jgi:SAM-dependent methyltransferase